MHGFGGTWRLFPTPCKLFVGGAAVVWCNLFPPRSFRASFSFCLLPKGFSSASGDRRGPELPADEDCSTHFLCEALLPLVLSSPCILLAVLSSGAIPPYAMPPVALTCLVSCRVLGPILLDEFVEYVNAKRKDGGASGKKRRP